MINTMVVKYTNVLEFRGTYLKKFVEVYYDI